MRKTKLKLIVEAGDEEKAFAIYNDDEIYRDGNGRLRTGECYIISPDGKRHTLREVRMMFEKTRYVVDNSP